MITGSNSITIHMEDGKRVYPCRCGQTHRGDYGHYEYGHHNCLHESPLIDLDIGCLLCPDCGMAFEIAEPDADGVYRSGKPDPQHQGWMDSL